MGYLDSKGLKKYTWNVRNRVAKNDQLTKAEKVVSFCPASESDLEPTINFKFTETLPAEGTKGPDNPSTFSGVSEVKVTRCGKNLLQTSNIVQTPNIGLTVSVNIDGSISVSGTTPSNSGCYLYFFNSEQNTSIGLPNFFLPGKTYVSTFSCNDENVDFNIIFYNGISWTPAYSNSATFIVPNDAISCLIRMRFLQDKTYDCTAKIQIELASTATIFEPYSGNEYTIQLGDTYYGGSVNFATGIMTVDWHAVKVSDMSNIAYDSTNNRWNMRSSPRADYTVHPVCSHAEYDITSVFTNATDGFFRWRAMGFYTEWWFKSPATTLEDFLSEYGDAYVVYKLYEPITIQLTPTQIKSLSSPDKYNPTLNTVYTDQESVQVGWIREDFIHRTGNEVIEGVKTFSNATPGSTAVDSVTDLTLRNPAVVRGVRGEGANWTRMIFADKEGNTEGNFAGRLGIFEIRSPKENDTSGEQFRFRCYKYSNNASDYSKAADIILGYDKDGIAYATAPEISEARTNSNDIVTRGHVNSVKSSLESTIEEKTWNWQKTEKARTVTCYPVGESLLEGIVEFKFKETLPAEGTKGPSNPSTITGVSQIGIGKKGKNIFGQSQQFNIDRNGVTFVYDQNKEFTLNGTATAYSNVYFAYDINIRVVVGNKITAKNTIVSGSYTNPQGGSIAFASLLLVNYDDGTYIYLRVNNDNTTTYTIPKNGKISAGYIAVENGASFTNCKIRAQFEFGNTASAWEAFSTDDIFIPFGNTYYGGSLDVATGVMTVTHDIVVINENSTFSSSIGIEEGADYYTVAFYPLRERLRNISNNDAVCNIFPIGGSVKPNVGFGQNSIHIKLYLTKAMLNLGDGASFTEVTTAAKTYFAEHPLQLIYKLANPYTVQLIPQQIKALPALDKYEPRVNTIYTDAESVQVGYQRYVDENNFDIFVDKESIISDEEIDEAFAE